MFDPMGDGRMRSDKVMLPEAMMDEPEELRGWIARAFESAAALPGKTKAPSKAAAKPSKKTAAKAAKKRPKAKVGAKR
jgi:hypothetical protein